MDRSLAVLGATKSIENARKLLEDSEVLLDRRRFGTSYALAIFALEEVAKAFVFHWVADGNLDETDLRKLIYQHRKKHAAIHLMVFFEVFVKFLGPQFVAALGSDSTDFMLNLDKESIAHSQNSKRQVCDDKDAQLRWQIRRGGSQKNCRHIQDNCYPGGVVALPPDAVED